MNYYEQKQLQDREARMIGAGVAFILMAPAFGIVAGIFLLSTIAMYVVTGLFVLIGIGGIVGAVRERIERKNNISN